VGNKEGGRWEGGVVSQQCCHDDAASRSRMIARRSSGSYARRGVERRGDAAAVHAGRRGQHT